MKRALLAVFVLAVFVLPNAGFAQTVKTVTISNAQLLAANMTPITIISAPGAGKAVIVVNDVYEVVGATTPFTEGSGGNYLFYGNPAAGVRADAGDQQVFTVAATGNFFSTAGGAIVRPTNAMFGANQPVVFSTVMNPLAGGDGTARITVFYIIAPL